MAQDSITRLTGPANLAGPTHPEVADDAPTIVFRDPGESRGGAHRRMSRTGAWRYALQTANLPRGHDDVVTTWLVLTRAAVLPMTLTAGAVAALLAVGHKGLSVGWLLLSIVGLTLAHVSNNLMNDLSDTDAGSDTADYPRALYAPHPILSGLITRRGLVTATLVVNALDLLILVVLAIARGWPIIVFALAGFLLSVAYTTPPLRLKKRGLGELDVLVVWGPLMVAGTYYAALGSAPWQVYVASLPYGLLCTAVLFGKHIDKIAYDEPLGIKTVPVLLGAARSRQVMLGLMAGFYVLVVVCILVGALPWPTLVALAGLVTLRKAWPYVANPAPAEPPANYPVWPLWYAPAAFLHTRRAGALLVLGLLAAAVLGIHAF